MADSLADANANRDNRNVGKAKPNRFGLRVLEAGFERIKKRTSTNMGLALRV
jgi:hypothetical protein